ncbi:hypothetical protein [Pseudobacteroides cellulosolvens]|uniref:Copper amine oxidase family protein n=1 Tax=Pseudobacteroides cellulosolvens ATCC 35603 = DSM 2933 TaxID=398512 RepID=A0A0L6JXW1_9FIRM|nr:hypothetical protein [Pseudobacteroides cellulosolvens]KNY30604.1 copper amine oxidase family protein [Pseudobacteroides cellulosolvens ATCC 35603 = DSM 2933]
MKRIYKILIGIFAVSITSVAAISIVWSYDTVRKIEATVNDNIKIYLNNDGYGIARD